MKNTKSNPQAISNFFQLQDATTVSNQLFEIVTMLQESDTFTSAPPIERSNICFTIQSIGKLISDLATKQ